MKCVPGFLKIEDMKKVRIILLVITAYFAEIHQTNAHAIWIESKPKASKNKAHEVNVFYGEYTEGQPDSVRRWYSDLKDLEVWLTSPSKKRTQLQLKDVLTHLTSSFIPDEDGLYYISTVHATKDLGGTTKYEFSSIAPVLVGNINTEAAGIEQTLSVIAQPKTFKTNSLIELQVAKGAEVFSGAEVSIMSPEGWVKTVKTDDKGQVSFTPKLKGSYVIETSEFKKEEGEWDAKKYKAFWKGSTTHILVN